MRILKAASLAAAALLLPASAQAAIKITGISGDPGFRSGTIHYSGPLGTLPNSGPSVNVSVGQIKLTGKDTTTNAAVSFLAYCIDIFDYLKAGLFDVANFTFNPAKEQKLRMLVPQDADNNQTQVFLVSTPVPEPSTWALLILGFGVVGGAMRRGRLHAAFA
jgi:hypothetical protein